MRRPSSAPALGVFFAGSGFGRGEHARCWHPRMVIGGCARARYWSRFDVSCSGVVLYVDFSLCSCRQSSTRAGRSWTSPDPPHIRRGGVFPAPLPGLAALAPFLSNMDLAQTEAAASDVEAAAPQVVDSRPPAPPSSARRRWTMQRQAHRDRPCPRHFHSAASYRPPAGRSSVS